MQELRCCSVDCCCGVVVIVLGSKIGGFNPIAKLEHCCQSRSKSASDALGLLHSTCCEPHATRVVRITGVISNKSQNIAPMDRAVDGNIDQSSQLILCFVNSKGGHRPPTAVGFHQEHCTPFPSCRQVATSVLKPSFHGSSPRKWHCRIQIAELLLSDAYPASLRQ